MNLGQLIKRLKTLPPDMVFEDGFGEAGSWRGDYSEVAFSPAKNVPVAQMLKHAKKAVGATFTGYKGGDFTMDKSTTAHIAEYGHCDCDGEDVITNAWFDLQILKARNQAPDSTCQHGRGK